MNENVEKCRKLVRESSDKTAIVYLQEVKEEKDGRYDAMTKRLGLVIASPEAKERLKVYGRSGDTVSIE